MILSSTQKRVIEEVDKKLSSKFDYYGRHALCSRHEALGLLSEEWHELNEAVGKDAQLTKIRAELLDIAVAAIYAMMSIDDGGFDW